MGGAITALVLIVATVLVIGLLSHLLLLAAAVTTGYLVGHAHAKGKLALGRRRSRGSLGQ